MKRLRNITSGIAVAVALLACAGGHDLPPPPSQPPPMGLSLSTAEILAQAQVKNETDVPYAVDGGAVTINDTSETSDPISISGM